MRRAGGSSNTALRKNYCDTYGSKLGAESKGLSPLLKSSLIPTINQTGYAVRLLLLVPLGDRMELRW